jgi:enamine deaminase RidA (YjgF/YER057c/UK114 family)
MPLKVRFVNPSSLAKPAGYTHVAEVTGGRTIYISGQVPADQAGNVVGIGDFAAQTVQVFENLKLALAEAGATFGDVVKVNMYVTDMSYIQVLREIRLRYYGANAPVSTLVEVSRLARPEFMIEIEVIAVVPEAER